MSGCSWIQSGSGKQGGQRLIQKHPQGAGETQEDEEITAHMTANTRAKQKRKPDTIKVKQETTERQKQSREMSRLTLDVETVETMWETKIKLK